MTKVTKKSPVIAGLDMGTTKVACVIGEIGSSGQVEVVGVGVAQHQGMKQGIIINLEATVEAIKKAREEAELMAGVTLSSAWLSTGGTQIQSFNSSGMVAVRNPREITQQDIDGVIEAAKAIALPADRQVIHAIPQEFKIDDQLGINDPLGMSGVRLETTVHIITGNSSVIQNAIKCAEKAGLRVQGMVLQQLASSLAVATEDEKNLGCTVVDMGGGTCDLISFAQGCVIHTGSVPVGGINFTHDLALGLRTTQISAENLKRKYGCALVDMITGEESIEVEAMGGRKARSLQRRELCTILEARTEETLQLIKTELSHNELMKRLGSGLILTGGTSVLPGLMEMGEFIFDVPVRRGAPDHVGGLTDIVRCASFSAAIGLILYGIKQEKHKVEVALPVPSQVKKNSFSDLAKRFKDIFSPVV